MKLSAILPKLNPRALYIYLDEGGILLLAALNSIKELAKISAKIEMKRNELGMNQKEFARMMNVSQGMVSKWKSGEYKVIHTSFGRKSDLSKELEAVALLNTEVIA